MVDAIRLSVVRSCDQDDHAMSSVGHDPDAVIDHPPIWHGGCIFFEQIPRSDAAAVFSREFARTLDLTDFPACGETASYRTPTWIEHHNIARASR